MAIPTPVHSYTPEEYLALERAASARSEYIYGDIVAMAGASHAHSLIAANVLSALHAALRNLPCEVHGSDLRISVADGSLYTYPDVTVVCGAPSFEDGAADTVTNPTVIVEVLSPATEAYDRGETFARCRVLPSLRAYVLVAQDRPRVEWYTRGERGWLLQESHGSDAFVDLTEPTCRVALSDVFARVAFGTPQFAR